MMVTLSYEVLYAVLNKLRNYAVLSVLLVEIPQPAHLCRKN